MMRRPLSLPSLCLCVCLCLLVALLAGVPGPGGAARAAEVLASPHDGYGRIVFRWDVPVRYTVLIRGNALVAEFDAPVPSDVSRLPQRLPDYVRSVQVSADRRTVTMPLRDDFTLRVFTLGSGVVVDLRGGPPIEASAEPPRRPTPSATPAPTAAPTRDPDTVRLRTGSHDGFERFVFDWTRPVEHRLERAGRRLTVTFDRPVPVAVGGAQDDLPEGFSDIQSRTEGEISVFSMTIPAGATARAFRDGPKVVVDVTVPDVTPERVAATAPTLEPAPEVVVTPEPAESETPSGRPAMPPELARRVAPELTGRAADAQPVPVTPPDAESTAVPPADVPPLPAITMTPVPQDQPENQPENQPEGMSPVVPTNDADGTMSEDSGANRPNVAAMEPIAEGGPALTPGAAEAMAERLAEDMQDSGEAEQAPTGPPVVSLGFSWDKPTASAVFRRSGYLWVVFDRFQEVDLSLLRRAGAGVVQTIDQVRMSPNSTVVRMTTAPGYNPSLRREGLLWVVDLMRQPLRPERPIKVQAQTSSPVGARLLLPVVEGGQVVPVRDPERGDQFFVLPLIQLGHGISPARAFPEVILPETAQGVVVVPLSERIEMRSSRSGAEVTADGGLILSPENSRLETLASLGDGALKEVFDIPGWRRADAQGRFSEVLNDLRYAVAMAPRSRQDEARLELARFLFANGYAPEALGVLRTLANESPEMVNTAPFRALRGATNFLMRRDGEAVDDLGHPSLADVDEAAFWRAAAQSRLGHAGLQAAVLEATGAVLENYPPDVRIPLALVAADAAIEAGDDLAGNTFLEAARDPEYNTTHDESAIQYLQGKLLASTGAFEPAIAAWREAEMGYSRRHAAMATRDRLDMEYRLDLIDREQLINGLEGLRFAWRGGTFEYELLKELGALYLEDQRYGDALRTLRLAASYFQDRPGAEELTETMRTVFDTLFLEGAANDMAPLTAIALFDEFRELTPTGTKGDEMIRRLADRLVSVDLLDPAAALLERQIRYRLRGLDRSKVGARLALVYLLNRQPHNALEALDKTRFAPLPERLERQRRHLRARGLADTDDPDAAIALLENDPSEDARVLRAEINWRNQNWAEAARALAELVPPPPAEGEAMDEKDAFRLIDWATALTLASDETAVSLLRQRYLDTLAGTPFENAFDLVTATPESGVIDIASVGGKIRQAEKFRSYLTAYRDKLRAERLSAIN